VSNIMLQDVKSSVGFPWNGELDSMKHCDTTIFLLKNFATDNSIKDGLYHIACARLYAVRGSLIASIVNFEANDISISHLAPIQAPDPSVSGPAEDTLSDGRTYENSNWEMTASRLGDPS
jgi:hypothetical protein